MASCGLCGCALDPGARVAGVSVGDGRGVPEVTEASLGEGEGSRALLYFCAEHVEWVRTIQSLFPTPSEIEARVRGYLFQELDVLAYALEMECAEAIRGGRDEDAARAQQTRLGVRLAQRLVGNVPAPEVDDRLRRWRASYLAKFPA